MENEQLRPLTRGLTQLKTVQVIEDPSEPFIIQSLNNYVFCGVLERITGIGFGNETQILSALNATLRPPKQLRIFSIFIEGGDVQPSPKDADILAQKKVLSLDCNTSKFIRTLTGEVLHVPSDRVGYVKAVSGNPNLISKLWDHPSFQHLNAIQWRGELVFNSNIHLTGMRMITMRDPSIVRHVQCIQDSKASLDNVIFADDFSASGNA